MRSVADRDLVFGGMNSGDQPDLLPVGDYTRAFNTLSRGGLLQCRPGFKWIANYPSGNLQGATFFQPTSGAPQIVCIVDGKAYVSTYPFQTFDQITGLQFSTDAEQVYFAHCEQAVERRFDGTLVLRTPRSLLIIQDGLSAPGYWDGADRGQVRGGISDAKLPLGTAMAWAGSRLWVARGNRVFASDIADPLSFFEGFYFGDVGAFILPGRVTAMAETPSTENPALVVFTDTTTTFFQSNIRDRDAWVETPDFQKTILPDVGCVAPRSVVAHNGVLWWYAGFGLTTLNVALSSKHSGKMVTLDDGMAWSKGRLSSDLSGIACASFENYLLCSVPYCDNFNRHTWVRDTRGKESWQGYWTGIRPVQWFKGFVNGSPRLFCVSKDRDGVNRLWEAFDSDRHDNGCPITWGVVTRGYHGNDDLIKKFRWADVAMTELQGTVDVSVSWAGTDRGRFKNISTKRIQSARGSLVYSRDLRFDQDEFGYKKQMRTIRTQDQRATDFDPLTSCGVENDEDEGLDTSYQLCVLVSGAGAIKRIRLTYETEIEKPEGRCEQDETNIRASRHDGADASGDSFETVNEILQPRTPVYTSTQSVTVTKDATVITASGTASTVMGQKVADKQAQAIAAFRASQQMQENGPLFVGSFISV